MVVANHQVGEETISVLLNNGDGTFAPAGHYTVIGRPYWTAVGDVDGDSDPDVVVSDYFGHTVAVLLNDGAGTLSGPTYYSVGILPTILTLALIDGDAYLDIVVANSADATVSVLINNGDGTFARPATYPVSFNPYGVVARDFDNGCQEDLDATILRSSLGARVVLRIARSGELLRSHTHFLL